MRTNRPLPPVPSESEFQKHVLAVLNTPGRPTRFYRQNSGDIVLRDNHGKVRGAYKGAPKGAADLTGIAAPDGLKVEVEIKVSARQTNPQRRWADLIERFGGVYVLIRYNKRQSMHWNVMNAIRTVDEAIADRRKENAEPDLSCSTHPCT